MAIADTAAALADATTPTVHFDLLTKAKGAADATATAVVTTDDVAEAKTDEITIAGVSDNFELKQSGTDDTGKYEFAVKSDVKDKEWNWVDISLKGACSKAETTDDLVAPKFIMTWSWVDPTTGPQLSVTTAGVFTITGLTAGKNYKSLTMTGELSDGTSSTFHVNNDPSAVTWDESGYSATDGGRLVCTVSKAWGQYWDEQKAGQTIRVTLTLSDNTTVEKTVVLEKE